MRAFFEQTSLAVTALGIVFAVCNCFFGYRLRKLWIALSGFCIGGLIGFIISMLMGQDAGISTLIGVTVGAAAALLAFKLYLCGIFLLCGGLSFFLGMLLIPEDLASLIAVMLVLCCIALSIIVGIIAVKAICPVVMVTTAFTGGYAAVSGLFLLFHAENKAAVTLLGILLGVGGLAFQFVDEKRRQKLKQAAPPYASPDVGVVTAAADVSADSAADAAGEMSEKTAESGLFAPDEAANEAAVCGEPANKQTVQSEPAAEAENAAEAQGAMDTQEQSATDGAQAQDETPLGASATD